MYEQVDVAEHRRRGPSVWDSATELPKVMMEMTSLAYLWPMLASEPRGDGHPVMVLPGFTAGDQSTLVLRRLLTRLNYNAIPWQLGQNTGSYEIQDRLLARFQELVGEQDEKITLIGQSLGGVFARILATRWPERVRQVITLGSPFASASTDSTNALVGQLFRYLSGMSEDEMRDQMLEFPSQALPVPSTAIYSKTDGVVHWSTCLEYAGEQAENVEVLGSHSGMGFNPMVLHVIADRLAQAEGRWAPFVRSQGCRSLLYPKPAAKSDG